ncbi:hypothetical protein BAUCODRAFT_565422 [Baudoinia panamericana UAMH 10762]|uniref:Methyltransferase domain-containing protein n=1 Tax=Baudoinia panamericana (strain UAMH 10762) TaxID=717646 RepID=M2N724_BAUPA|nr:uncharacterized protein BAUCODRAFT_565422 [Baudoinia panamericana UAMH 10762]EMC94879.1 hypothetical protein BAUCODRAFT_565422 [Baudoinia panamericana UAMH 10762]
MASAVANIRATSGGNARFNKEALSWDARPFVYEASQAAAEAVLSKLKSLDRQPKQVLEIGCGTGTLSFLIAPHVDRVVAVDAADGMIEVLKIKLAKSGAPTNILPVAVLLEDPEDGSLPGADSGKPESQRQKFDLIISHLVLHHIPDLGSVLRTMLGCLKPGGCVMLTDFEDFGPEAKRFHPASKMAGVERHGIDAAAMSKLMHDIGFKHVSVQAEWTMRKRVESFDGEFGGDDGLGMAKQETGESMSFPFLLCYGERAD